MARLTVFAACATSLAIGLFFIFVWAPHPWGWQGFDQYYDLARTLAHGGSFPTTDVPWGYALFLAPFYRLFGDRPWIPLIAQAVLNALTPLFVYAFAKTEFDGRVAAVAAAVTGVLSFNTVYASTQSSDAVCNVIFMGAVVVFARARRRGDWRLYAAAGALLGVAAQFRPNLLLVPCLLAAFLVVERRRIEQAARALVLILASTLMLVPWIVRNYELTGEIIPASTHGGVQLWYGTLQTGPYLKSQAYNPRSVFETGSFPYTSLDRVPLIVTGRLNDCSAPAPALALVYWTDRDSTHRRVPVRFSSPREFRADAPPSPAPTVYYFFVDGIVPSRADAPYVYFVSTDHLGDLDRHGDVLDIFDIVRLLRHIAWREPVANGDRLDFDHDGQWSARDMQIAVDALLANASPPHDTGGAIHIAVSNDAVVLHDADGSTISVPKGWSRRLTDIDVRGADATTVLHTAVPFDLLREQRRASGTSPRCAPLASLAVNAPYYREQPHAMRRYVALAMDNIRRDPAAYAASVAYRAIRVFFIEGSTDLHTAQQFTGGGRIYRAANAVSIGFLVLFAAGVWTAWRQGAAIGLPLLLIAYIPATLAFVLTNMRYSITVQPLIFVFIASALVAAWDAGQIHPRRQ